jgi:hypothetical protein
MNEHYTKVKEIKVIIKVHIQQGTYTKIYCKWLNTQIQWEKHVM